MIPIEDELLDSFLASSSASLISSDLLNHPGGPVFGHHPTITSTYHPPISDQFHNMSDIIKSSSKHKITSGGASGTVKYEPKVMKKQSELIPFSNLNKREST